MGSVPQLTMDLSHHINVKSRARHPSPMKDIIKYLGNEGMISLAGGMLVSLGIETGCIEWIETTWQKLIVDL